MNETRIIGIFINERVKEASLIQNILTKYGCSIKTRLGLHEVASNFCSPSGLILLELHGDTNEMLKLENDLLTVEGIQVQKMTFKK